MAQDLRSVPDGLQMVKWLRARSGLGGAGRSQAGNATGYEPVLPVTLTVRACLAENETE